MKKALIIIGIIVAAIGMFIFTSPKTEAPQKDTKASSSKPTFQTIQNDIEKGAYLIDVRTPEEYKAGHFEKAINFDSVDIDAGKTPQVAKDAKIYVYCRSGNRSAAATAKLKAAGFTNITDLGGLEDVKTIGGGELVK